MTRKIFTRIAMIMMTFAACKGQNSQVVGSKLEVPILDTTQIKVLVVTEVKKPWYAWRALVASRMTKTIPEYQQIEGLKEKYYSFTQDHTYFGGIYLWQNRLQAEAWFDDSWFDRIEKKYGVKGQVGYFMIDEITTISQIPSQSQNLYAAISYSNGKDVSIQQNANGLLKYGWMKDDKETSCLLSIWRDKDSAMAYFGNKASINRFFDIPVYLRNSP